MRVSINTEVEEEEEDEGEEWRGVEDERDIETEMSL